jgi:hypothetical protein
MKREGRKKIKDTKVGIWLKEKAPEVLDTVGELLPDQGALGVVKRLIDLEPNMSAQEKMEFQKMLMDYESNAQDNVTERWKSDMMSDSWLSKNIRPMMLIFLILSFTIFVAIDSITKISFELKDAYIDMLQILMTTAFTAYFAGRSYEKVNLNRR